jgi:hypothetical protein
MDSTRPQVHSTRQAAGQTTSLVRVVLRDRVRLPWRFFGRLTAAVQAGL